MELPTTETEKVKNRLRELRLEFEQGQAALAELDKQRHELRDGLLRLAGAIQVLGEFVQAPLERPEQLEATVPTHGDENNPLLMRSNADSGF